MLFKNTTYVSETTEFLRDFLQQHPDVAEGQVEGRALLWDRPIDRDAQKQAGESRVPVKAYAYQPD